LPRGCARRNDKGKTRRKLSGNAGDLQVVEADHRELIGGREGAQGGVRGGESEGDGVGFQVNWER